MILKMKGARSIHNATTEYIKNFTETYESNMAWLLEVFEEAQKIAHGPSVWLPRTPAAKKPAKRTFAHVGAGNQESTFRDGSEKKKLKIDDLSTIDGSASEANESIINGSRSLRPRRGCAAKAPVQKKQQPKRNTKKTSAKKDEEVQEVESIATPQAFKPPPSIEPTNLDETNSSDLTLKLENNAKDKKWFGKGKKVGFGDDLKSKLFDSDPDEEKNKESVDGRSPPSRPVPVIADDSIIDEPDVCSDPVSSSTPDVAERKPVEIVGPSPLVGSEEKDSVSEEEEEVGGMQNEVFYSAERGNGESADTETPQRPIPSDYQTPVDSFETPLPPLGATPLLPLGDPTPLQLTSPRDGRLKNSNEVGDGPIEEEDANEKEEEQKEEMKDREGDEKETEIGEQVQGNLEEEELQQEQHQLEEELIAEQGEKKSLGDAGNDSSDGDRRGTYKVMVNDINNGDQPPLTSFHSEGEKCAPLSPPAAKKAPKINKPLKPSNLVSNVKSFIKRPAPTKEEPIKPSALTKQRSGEESIKSSAKPLVKQRSAEEEPIHHAGNAGNIVNNIKSFIKKPEAQSEQTEADSEAEKQRKEKKEKKTMEEIQKKKQMQLEERKRQQQEREKRIAEQQRRIAEEEETKREQLKIKAAQIAKNQEQIQRKKLEEQKLKQKEREMKMAKVKGRIQDQDEEKEKKAKELLLDEKRKQEMLEKNHELEKQKREQARLEKERYEEEKRKKMEESKMYDEERQKREFEEKEKHRILVEEKKKKEKENYLLEKQQRLEREQQAAKEIADAKKNEEDKVKREEERLRKEEARKKREEQRIRIMEETKEKAKLLAFQKPHIPNHLRPSPTLPQENQPPKPAVPCPVVPLVQRDSVFVDYGLDDFDSGDSTDDDTAPAKPVPSWAVGSRLKKQLMKQFYTDIEPDDIFTNAMQPLRLEQIFNKNKTRYFKRTSSAHWSSPPLKGGDLFKPRKEVK